MPAEEKVNPSIFERNIGKAVKVMVYPLEGEDDLLRIDVVYSLLSAKKQGQSIVVGDNYRCGDDTLRLLDWIKNALVTKV